MKRAWFPILVVVGLFGLLVLLATLQYRWLSQISQSEKEQMQKRLETDTEHFTEDFNRTVQAAYFPFQLYDDNWQKDFIVRYQNWHKHADYPDLIKDFYFVPKTGDALAYNFEYYQFLKTDFTANFDDIKTDFAPIDEKNFILRMPIYKQSEKLVETRFVETDSTANSPLRITKNLTSPPRPISLPEVTGYLLIKLDQTVLKEKVLRNLTRNYFYDGSYKISVVSRSDNTAIFQTQPVENSDATAKIFALQPDDIAVFVNQALLSSLNKENSQSRMIFDHRVESKVIKIPSGKQVTTAPGKGSNGKFNITITGKDEPRIYQTDNLKNDGIWTLNVQHVAGSLDDFVANTRNKNLAISFGILSLLGASVVLIFISTQRAKNFAQRQVDFVSAVSHEFRTPLAVIYSAGENLTDGIVNSEKQIAQYGDLIKREGKKLSQMVEQILEFAGARSGRRQYDLREADVKTIVENALAECQPLLNEKGFTVETSVAENLPKILADENALSHAIQNLITNAVKYGDGSRWIKVAASGDSECIKILIEDKGIGIAPKDVSNIFTPFYRAKSVVDAQIHGNGLGLSLVKQTVEAHGGKISVESAIGKGSRFTIEMKSGKVKR
ncbi:MAG: HAMP domain-containing histidine kinase [Acidobacteriota bacterium]|nr:HAMP domain-containing histidine kinase [Acidobacteriota bacterium]